MSGSLADRLISLHWIRSLNALLAVLVVIGLSLSSASAANGDLDPTFATGAGFRGFDSYLVALFRRPDGKLMAVGGNLDFVLARYYSDGTVDDSFGSGGKILFDGGAADFDVLGAVLQPDGKVVVLFSVQHGFFSGPIQMGVRRFKEDGTVDMSFGTNGVVELSSAAYNTPGGLVLQPDDKIVVGGATSDGGGYDCVLFRLNTDGSLDISFGAGGKVRTDFGRSDGIYGVALQPDGKIVVGGYSGDNTTPYNFALARYTQDGGLDPSFGGGGKVTTSFSSSAYATAVVIQSDGKIVAEGLDADTNHTTEVARYLPDGNLDPSFGAGGKTSFPNLSETQIALRADGKLVLAGYKVVTPSSPGHDEITDFSLLLLNANGSPDTTFGTNGQVATDFGGPSDYAKAILLQPDGKIVLGGTSTDNTVGSFALARYVTDSVGPAKVDAGPGSYVTATSGNAAATFSNVSQAGTTTFTQIDPVSAGAPPSGYTIVSSNPGYEITTTATYSGSIDVCFKVSSFDDPVVFSKLRLLHGENGVLVDRTFQQFFSSREICARVNSLSPFVLAMTNTPFVNPITELLNISTRLNVGTDPNQLIGGFTITGTEPKKVIILATGPSLDKFGLTGLLADPILELYQGSTVIASNDNWEVPDKAAIEATGFQPAHKLESALLRTLPPGAYTAVVRVTNGGTGLGTVQLYDLAETTKSTLANIAARGVVEAPDNRILIGGFIIGGNGGGNSHVIVRALGPSLIAFQIGAPLPDPTLEIKNANGSTLAFNDDWQQSPQADEIRTRGLAPADKESAVMISLPNGGFTAIVRGKGGATGVAVVEVYNVE
jgi:uncharacterized delta-60 repeat protein